MSRKVSKPKVSICPTLMVRGYETWLRAVVQQNLATAYRDKSSGALRKVLVDTTLKAPQ